MPRRVHLAPCLQPRTTPVSQGPSPALANCLEGDSESRTLVSVITMSREETRERERDREKWFGFFSSKGILTINCRIPKTKPSPSIQGWKPLLWEDYLVLGSRGWGVTPSWGPGQSGPRGLGNWDPGRAARRLYRHVHLASPSPCGLYFISGAAIDHASLAAPVSNWPQ